MQQPTVFHIIDAKPRAQITCEYMHNTWDLTAATEGKAWNELQLNFVLHKYHTFS